MITDPIKCAITTDKIMRKEQSRFITYRDTMPLKAPIVAAPKVTIGDIAKI
jgi:hypothetical protein